MKKFTIAVLLVFLALPLFALPYFGVGGDVGASFQEYGGSKALRLGGSIALQAGASKGIFEFYGSVGGGASFPIKQWKSFTVQPWSWSIKAGGGAAIRFDVFRLALEGGYSMSMMMAQLHTWTSGIYVGLEPSLVIATPTNGLISLCLPVRYTYSKTSPSLELSFGVRFSSGGTGDSVWL